MFFLFLLAALVFVQANPFEATSPGSLIVLNGTFVGNFVIDKPVTLVGGVFDGGGNGTVLKIVASGVRIKGVVVRNCGRSGLDSGIWIENARDVVIEDVTVEECLYPIMIYNSSNVKIVNSRIASFRSVPVARFEQGGVVVLHELTQYFRGHGVYVWYSWNVTVAKSYFTHTLDGVYCDHAYGLRVVDNVFFNGSRYGVHLMYCAGVVIANNTVSQYVVGFIPMYSERVEIVGNQVFDVRAIGGAAVVVFESNNVTVRNNIFARNYIAVDFYRSPFTPGSFVEVVDNVIAYNNIGVRLDPISSPTIYGNYFVENVRDVLPLFNNKARLYNATAKRGNFWGTSTSRYVAGQRVFDQILSEHPQMEILALSPAYGLMEYVLGVAYPGGGVLEDKYPIPPPGTPHGLYLLYLALASVLLAYVWRRS